jgi:hypothetical protein
MYIPTAATLPFSGSPLDFSYSIQAKKPMDRFKSNIDKISTPQPPKDSLLSS